MLMQQDTEVGIHVDKVVLRRGFLEDLARASSASRGAPRGSRRSSALGS